MTSLNVFMSRGFMSRGLRSGAVVFAAATCLALAGCAGGAPADPGTSSPAPTTSATSTPSPTPTPTPSAVYKPADASGPAQNVPVPVLPEVAKTETKEGAEAFTKYWFSVLSYAYETGDTQPLADLSGPNCVFCSGLKDNVTAAWGSGRWISGGKIQTPAIAAEVAAGEPSYAIVQVIQDEVEIRKPDGSLYQDPTAATNTGSRADATFGASGWIIADLGLIR